MLLSWYTWTFTFILALTIVSAENGDNTELTGKIKTRDVNKTIAKVEAILKKNPNLPRLTRGEILSLLDNITKADADKKKKKQQGYNTIMDEKTRNEYERALMVVLPFQANRNANNTELQELYTKSPITKIVLENVTTERIETTTRKNRRRNQFRRKPPMQERPIMVLDEEPRPVYVPKPPRTSTTTSTAMPTTTENSWKPYTGMELRNPQPFGFHNSAVKDNNENESINIPQQMKQTLADIGIPKNHKPETFFVTPQEASSTIRPSSTSTTSTSKPPQQPLPDLSIAVQSLTPDMKKLLISFGLLNADGTPASQQTAKSTTAPPSSVFEYKPINPTVDPSSYISFKPLPNSKDAQKGYDDMNNEMKTFLASYGLLTDTGSGVRGQKSLNTSQTVEPMTKTGTTTQFSLSNINTDILNKDMKNILENLGLMKTSQRQSKGHIFNPTMHTADLFSHSDESQKINKLLGTIKELKEAEKNKSLSEEEIAAKLENISAGLATEPDANEDESTDASELSYEGYEPAEEELLKLQNGITDEDLDDDNGAYNFYNEIATNQTAEKNQNKSKTLQQSFDAPDPLSSEELTQIHQSYKNEVKRQQPNVTSTPSTESSDPESTEPVMEDATEPSSSSPRDSSPSLSDLEDSFGGDNPTTSRPNGLYFLVDWNTFLRVGTDNKTVDLNFSPKVGDPRNFLPVNVP